MTQYLLEVWHTCSMKHHLNIYGIPETFTILAMLQILASKNRRIDK